MDQSLIRLRGRIYVMTTDALGGLRCTARTRRRTRCLCTVDIGHGRWTQWGSRIGLITAWDLATDRADAVLNQRCKTHDTPDSADFCSPELDHFDPVRHAFLVRPLTDEWERIF